MSATRSATQRRLPHWVVLLSVGVTVVLGGWLLSVAGAWLLADEGALPDVDALPTLSTAQGPVTADQPYRQCASGGCWWQQEHRLPPTSTGAELDGFVLDEDVCGPRDLLLRRTCSFGWIDSDAIVHVSTRYVVGF